MSYLKFNDLDLPSVRKGITVSVSMITSSARNANGVLVRQKIGRTQYKLENVEWPQLSPEEWESILEIINSGYFDVTFMNPETNQPITIKMHCDEKTAVPYYVGSDDRPAFYRNCKINLIDSGE
jgi:hypothetical protein